ncbi:MAG: hypothetical protein WBG50_22500, partial [Desulfomonilaceae bacterium]
KKFLAHIYSYLSLHFFTSNPRLQPGVHRTLLNQGFSPDPKKTSIEHTPNLSLSFLPIAQTISLGILPPP